MVQKKENNTTTIYLTDCLGCKKHTNNMAPRGVTITHCHACICVFI